LGLFLAIGLVFPSMMAVRPPAAHASAFCDVFGEGFPGCGVLHGVPEFNCYPSDIVAHGKAKSHDYTFGLSCDSGQQFNSISASYDASTLMASERLAFDGQKITQIFICSTDPWSVADGVACHEAVTHAGGPPTADYARPDWPSAQSTLTTTDT
jgi:hypothetical protein